MMDEPAFLMWVPRATPLQPVARDPSAGSDSHDRTLEIQPEATSDDPRTGETPLVQLLSGMNQWRTAIYWGPPLTNPKQAKPLPGLRSR